MACEKIFLKRLRESGLRLTPQREMILAVMHQLEGVSTVEEIYGRVHAQSSTVDISTVYRTLELLQGFKLVARIDAGSDQHRYELLGVHGPHLHLACQSCGKVIGVSLAEAEPFVAHLRAAYDFEAELDNVTIPGLCGECRSAASQRLAPAI